MYKIKVIRLRMVIVFLVFYILFKVNRWIVVKIYKGYFIIDDF